MRLSELGRCLFLHVFATMLIFTTIGWFVFLGWVLYDFVGTLFSGTASSEASVAPTGIPCDSHSVELLIYLNVTTRVGLCKPACRDRRFARGNGAAARGSQVTFALDHDVSLFGVDCRTNHWAVRNRWGSRRP